jgi:hypothetical protein
MTTSIGTAALRRIGTCAGLESMIMTSMSRAARITVDTTVQPKNIASGPS